MQFASEVPSTVPGTQEVLLNISDDKYHFTEVGEQRGTGPTPLWDLRQAT